MKETNDIVLKNFEAWPDVAADILNALLYEGQQLVKAENLLPAPTESIYQGKSRMRSQYEDLEKYEIAGKEIKALYLFANQTSVDRKILLRKAGYVGAAYREQYDRKIPALCPVIELVLYWGYEKWSGMESIHSAFEKKQLPDNIWNYADDIRLHVWEMRFLPEEVRRHFKSDMRIVVDYLAQGTGYRSDRMVVHKEALIKVLRVLSGEELVEDTAKILAEMNVREEDTITMCELFDQYTRKGKAESLVANVESLKASLSVTLEKACSLLDTPVEEYFSAKKLLGR